MKLTKTKIKKILMEEIEKSDSALLSAIGLLTQKIEDLDVSIDYLAGAVTGESPATIGYSQSSLGRFAIPVKPRKSSGNANSPFHMNEIEQIINQEIEAVLAEMAEKAKLTEE